MSAAVARLLDVPKRGDAGVAQSLVCGLLRRTRTRETGGLAAHHQQQQRRDVPSPSPSSSSAGSSRCKVCTRARLGRSGGAVHGAKSSKGRRRQRLPPPLPEQDGGDSGTESDGARNGYAGEEGVEFKASGGFLDSAAPPEGLVADGDGGGRVRCALAPMAVEEDSRARVKARSRSSADGAGDGDACVLVAAAGELRSSLNGFKFSTTGSRGGGEVEVEVPQQVVISRAGGFEDGEEPQAGSAFRHGAGAAGGVVVVDGEGVGSVRDSRDSRASSSEFDESASAGAVEPNGARKHTVTEAEPRLVSQAQAEEGLGLAAASGTGEDLLRTKIEVVNSHSVVTVLPHEQQEQQEQQQQEEEAEPEEGSPSLSLAETGDDSSSTQMTGEGTASQPGQAGQVVDTVSLTAEKVEQAISTTVAQVAEQVTSTVADLLSADGSDTDADSDSDDEFEAFKTDDSAEFRGTQGLNNFEVVQEGGGVLTMLHDFYVYMMKKPLPEFALGMFLAPIINSLIFTVFYLPDFEGLALDDTAREFFAMKGEDVLSGKSFFLQRSWSTLFQVFMFSLSLSTGLEPELAPLSPFTLVVANVNALVSQILFVFLSGAVFARLSQPSQPVRCSSVALVCPPVPRRRKQEAKYKSLLVRYVLAGPQPCELVDVKIDLTYKFNSSTRTGTYFRAMQSLKLVRPEIAYQTLGMLVRHVIDETSPLYGRSPEMLSKEDGIFVFSVVALERASMQSIFHVQHYCVADDHVIWDAEFEDMILINKKNRRIVDHSKLSSWRPVKRAGGG